MKFVLNRAIGFPYRFTIKKSEFKGISKKCRRLYGSPKKDRWRINQFLYSQYPFYRIYIKDKEDAMIFILATGIAPTQL